MIRNTHGYNFFFAICGIFGEYLKLTVEKGKKKERNDGRAFVITPSFSTRDGS